MHTLSICFGCAVWPLLYKTKEAAEIAYNAANTGSGDIGLTDDFGQTVTIKPGSLHGLMLEDMDQTKMAHIERAMHQQRMQVLAQKTAQTDPALRAAAMMQGPGILDPQRMNGGRFGN